MGNGYGKEQERGYGRERQQGSGRKVLYREAQTGFNLRKLFFLSGPLKLAGL